MDAEQLRNRTKDFAIQIIEFCDDLPASRLTYPITKQLIRSGTSIGANYRAACRARSKKEFYAKLNIVEEEADEVVYWLELLQESSIDIPDVSSLLLEANELLAIFASSKKEVKNKL